MTAATRTDRTGSTSFPGPTSSSNMRATAGVAAGPANVARPRTDANSQTAHAQLLRKAKQGQHRRLLRRRLDHAPMGRARLSGAARELEGRTSSAGTPRTSAGAPTGSRTSSGGSRTASWTGSIRRSSWSWPARTTSALSPADDAKVADIAAGMKAVLDACRKKAPAATIILTAIFPRNDNMAVMPEITRINAQHRAVR